VRAQAGIVWPVPTLAHKATNMQHSKKKQTLIERAFETALFQCRFLALFAVIGSMVAALSLFLKGTIEICQGVIGLMHSVPYFVPTAVDDKIVILAFIPAVDNYLFAMVLLIFSMGVYELFISKIDPAVREAFSHPRWLKIDNLDDLKTQISEVVVMILIINFFQFSYTVPLVSPLDLVYFGGGILAIGASLFITHTIIAQRIVHGSHKGHHSEHTPTS
jgi:uncharacterized membrane protein YqhA